MDESVLVWILAAIQPIIVSWCVWVTNEIFHNKQELALNSQSDIDIKQLMRDVNSKMSSIDSHLNAILIALAKNNIEVK